MGRGESCGRAGVGKYSPEVMHTKVELIRPRTKCAYMQEDLFRSLLKRLGVVVDSPKGSLSVHMNVLAIQLSYNISKNVYTSASTIRHYFRCKRFYKN